MCVLNNISIWLRNHSISNSFNFTFLEQSIIIAQTYKD